MSRKRIEILYRSSGQTKRNTEPFVVLYNRPAWPMRILIQRGWSSMNTIYSREATDSEMEELERSWRNVAWKYKNVNLLINDEVRVLGEDHAEIRFLEDFKNEIKNI